MNLFIKKNTIDQCYEYCFGTRFDLSIGIELRVVNGPSRAGLAHFYLAHGHNGLDIMDY